MVSKYLGEMPGEASGDFPQVVSDLDVNRTMNLVLVLTSIVDMKKRCQQ